jgi:hypothetical protein
VKGQGKRPTIQKEKELEAPKKSPIEEEEEGQLLGPIGTTLVAWEKTHTYTHTQINIDMHFALCKATYDEGMWCHVLQRNNTHTQHNTISHLETNFHDMRDD